MFCADDDESTSLKTKVVHPNDVLDIEVSTGLLTTPTPSLLHAEEQSKTESRRRNKEKKPSKISTLTKTIAMKRGDPFLPSVFSDENPIADYTVKKNSRKKPSDCKCKGFGYNVSSSGSAAGRNETAVGEYEHIVRRISWKPDCGERKKHKKCYETVSGFKPKDITKSPNPVILSNTSYMPMIKRTACYSSKENSNIISTSNFHRTPLESTSSHNAILAETNSFKSVHSTGFVGTRCVNPTETMNCSAKGYNNNNSREDIGASSRQTRHRHQLLPQRRIMANISPSPVLTSSNISSGSGSYEAKKMLSRSSQQMLMMGSQGCACDSCRHRTSLMSRMEALGFSSSNAQQMLSPYMFSSSQRYQPVMMQSSITHPNRYAPYTVPNYGYTRNPGGVYRSPERYQCSSPTYYDYGEVSGYRRQPFSTSSLSIANEISKIESSFLDSENSLPSPPSTGYVEDITDLSIQDTVDFFVSMKSPFVNSSPSPVSDSSPGIYSALSPVDRCVSPSFASGSLSSCYCNVSSTSTFSIPPYKREISFGEPSGSKYATDTSQPISLLYSSLVSDLEDELQCAIENIPTV
ncbi:hypothetical protein Btru_040402 [Bulinus truncatus]|nr:hypothetical protein Btru_040402 [Bulinus truncatus]